MSKKKANVIEPKSLESLNLQTMYLNDIPLVDSSAASFTLRFGFNYNTDGKLKGKVNLKCNAKYTGESNKSFTINPISDSTVYDYAVLDAGSDDSPLEVEFYMDISPYNVVSNTLSGTMTVDELCQSSEILALESVAVSIFLNSIDEINRSKLNTSSSIIKHISLGPYIQQSMVGSNSSLIGLDLVKHVLSDLSSGSADSIPKEYFISKPDNIKPDVDIVTSVMEYIASGTPCTAMIGPTGSGKSFTARYIMSKLVKYGFAGIIIDANARTEGDRLFERDDFNSEGTFILEGQLLQFARTTKKLGLRGIVALEEYNAFSDSTRREFYRLFSTSDRYYKIESGNVPDKDRYVDFSHIQFLITANPITSTRYLVDDLKQLSNAEARRISMVYHDYVFETSTLVSIFKLIIESKPNYGIITKHSPSIGSSVNYNSAAKCFKLLNMPDSNGNRIGFDFGYSIVADWVWMAALRGNTVDAWITSSVDNLLNPIPDHDIRYTVANRLQSSFGIKIADTLIYRDA